MHRIGPDTTWYALLTPPTTGAIAVTCVVGPQAETIVLKHFARASHRPLTTCTLRRIYYGRWKSSADNSDLGEDLVICRVAPTTMEIHSHSGSFARHVIHRDLEQAGVISLPPREALHRLAPHRWLAEAQWALIAALTERSARWLLSQLPLWESFPRRVAEQIDAGDAHQALREIQWALDCANVSQRLIHPPLAAICGPPNVGKSSLVNRLLGFERAIVHGQPGTTRDVLTHLTAFDGWPVVLADMAGIRAAADPIERAGIELAQRTILQADLVVYVVDGAQASDLGILQAGLTQLPRSPDVIVINKSDLLGGQQMTEKMTEIRTNVHAIEKGVGSGLPVQYVSALTGDGISELVHRLAQLLSPP